MSRRTAVCVALGLGVVLGAGAVPAGSPDPGECSAWPGELQPLATVSDPDALRAQWARLRASELARAAAWLEARDGAEAERTWRHALCLDPGNAELARGAERAAALASSAPVVRPATPAPLPENAIAQAKPLPDVSAPPPQPDPCATGAEACPRLRKVDQSLARLEALLRDARFEEVLEDAARPRKILSGLPPSTATRRRQVRLETIAATAYVALDRRDLAVACFDRALAAEPALKLEVATTSPKVIRVLDDARSTHQMRRRQ